MSSAKTYGMIRLAMIVLVAVGCADTSSVAGPIGPVIDLRSRITKADVRTRAPIDDKATKQELAVDIRGVKTNLVWRTFEDGGTKYILSITWEVVTPSPNVRLELLGTLNTTNAGTVDAPVQEEIVRARWHKDRSFGEISVRIDANGRGAVI